MLVGDDTDGTGDGLTHLNQSRHEHAIAATVCRDEHYLHPVGRVAFLQQSGYLTRCSGTVVPQAQVGQKGVGR